MLQWLNDEKVKYFLVIFYFSFDGSEKICGIATPVGFVLSVPRAGRMFVISASSLLMYRHCMWCFVLEGRKIFFSQYLDILRQPLPFGTKHAWLEYTAGKIKGERKQCSRVYHETSAQKKKKKKTDERSTGLGHHCHLKHLSFTTQTMLHTPSPFILLVQKISFFYSPIALSPAEFFGRKGRGLSVEFYRLGFTLATDSKGNKIRLHAGYQTSSCTESIWS